MIFLTGTAYDYPHLGAAGVVADQYLPKAEGEETDHFFPQAGIIGIAPSRIYNKALGCLEANYVSDYSEKLWIQSRHILEPGHVCRSTAAARKLTGSQRTGSCTCPQMKQTSTARGRA